MVYSKPSSNVDSIRHVENSWNAVSRTENNSRRKLFFRCVFPFHLIVARIICWDNTAAAITVILYDICATFFDEVGIIFDLMDFPINVKYYSGSFNLAVGSEFIDKKYPFILNKRTKWSLPKLLYLLARYYGLVYLLWVEYYVEIFVKPELTGHLGLHSSVT